MIQTVVFMTEEEALLAVQAMFKQSASLMREDKGQHTWKETRSKALEQLGFKLMKIFKIQEIG